MGWPILRVPLLFFFKNRVEMVWSFLNAWRSFYLAEMEGTSKREVFKKFLSFLNSLREPSRITQIKQMTSIPSLFTCISFLLIFFLVVFFFQAVLSFSEWWTYNFYRPLFLSFCDGDSFFLFLREKLGYISRCFCRSTVWCCWWKVHCIWYI